MTKRKKLWAKTALSALIPTAIVPVAVAASCGDTVEALSPAQVENNARLNGAANYIEQTYQEKLIKTLNANFDNKSASTIANSDLVDGTSTIKVKDVAKYFVLQTVYADRSFLKSYGQALLNQAQSVLVKTGATGEAPVANSEGNYAKVNYADVNRYRLLEEVPSSGLPWIGEATQTALFDEFIELLLKSNLNSFRINFYKYIISLNYLDTTREDYNKVFRNSNLSQVTYRPNTAIDNDIEDASFLLTKQVLDIHPFATWSVSLTEAESSPYVTFTDLTLDAADALINVKTPADKRLALSYSVRTKLLPDHLKNLLHQSDTTQQNNDFVIDDLMSFGGLQRRTAVGSKSLSFTQNEMRKVVDPDTYANAYNGYVYENELRRSNIQLFAAGAKVISLTRVVGIMPTYENGKLNVNRFNKSELKRALYFLNAADIYNDALTYYTNRENPVLLEITNDYLKTLAIDNFGFKFIKTT